MKIRWTKNSVRLRITPGELQALQNGAPVSEDLFFPHGGHWRAVIEPGSESTAIALKEGALTFSLSAADGEKLAAPNAEGVYFQLDAEPPLRYFIEKDFPCIHPRPTEVAEPDTETFAPPPGFEERK